MGVPFITSPGANENNFLSDLPVDFENFDILEIIEKIRSKLPENRSNFEKEILKLYEKAEAKGAEFCKRKVKEEITNWIDSNRTLIYIIVGVVVLLIIVKSL